MNRNIEPVSTMEPLLPVGSIGELHEKASELSRKASRLSGLVQPLTAAALADLLRAMNSYYSNLIEGQSTHPLSIEKALNRQFEGEPEKKNLQKLALAHIQAQKEIEKRLAANPHENISSPIFLKWVHSEFYKNLPDEFLKMKHDGAEEVRIAPGEFRGCDVRVGRHTPPHYGNLSRFLERFEAFYTFTKHGPMDRIVAAAAAHHRLAWIHPFQDGNGRVMRLYTDAFFFREKLGGFGLWTISRGLARKREKYYEHLAVADDARKGDLDGRGALSDRSLSKFCDYFLDVAIDQVDYMSSVLDLDKVDRRLMSFFQVLHDMKVVRQEAFFLLREIFLRGEVARGEASRITGLADSTAREVVSRLMALGLIQSESPKSPIKIKFILAFAAYLFPSLYPEWVDVDFRAFEETLVASGK